MIVTIEVEDDAWQALPDVEGLTRRAVSAAFSETGFDAAGHELAILFTDDATMSELNAAWRGKPGPTNVLSFPAPQDLAVPGGEARPLGDIALASGVVAREAVQQGKPLPEHVAHLIIHGVLHLMGLDHEDEAEALAMEHLEAKILKGLGISDPYER